MKIVTWGLLVGALCFCLLVVAGFVLPKSPSVRFSSQDLSSVTLLPGTKSEVDLGETGIGYDPLTGDEADRALAAALRGGERQVLAGDQALEILLIERYDAPKGSAAAQDQADARQGEVYLYDYTTDTLIHNVVDVTTGAVTTNRLKGVQLPLTEREEQRAVELILADKALWQTLSARYEIITGDPLLDMTQLQVKVSLFLAESMPDQVNSAAQLCGEHRCAQVLLFTVDRTVLEVLPIVDLSEGEVIQLMSDSWIEAS